MQKELKELQELSNQVNVVLNDTKYTKILLDDNDYEKHYVLSELIEFTDNMQKILKKIYIDFHK